MSDNVKFENGMYQIYDGGRRKIVITPESFFEYPYLKRKDNDNRYRIRILDITDVEEQLRKQGKTPEEITKQMYFERNQLINGVDEFGDMDKFGPIGYSLMKDDYIVVNTDNGNIDMIILDRGMFAVKKFKRLKESDYEGLLMKIEQSPNSVESKSTDEKYTRIFEMEFEEQTEEEPGTEKFLDKDKKKFRKDPLSKDSPIIPTDDTPLINSDEFLQPSIQELFETDSIPSEGMVSISIGRHELTSISDIEKVNRKMSGHHEYYYRNMEDVERGKKPIIIKKFDSDRMEADIKSGLYRLAKDGQHYIYISELELDENGQSIGTEYTLEEILECNKEISPEVSYNNDEILNIAKHGIAAMLTEEEIRSFAKFAMKNKDESQKNSDAIKIANDMVKALEKKKSEKEQEAPSDYDGQEL